ncbi:hypothetical protein ABTH62_20135, partial [Acinetobacter baumannii]
MSARGWVCARPPWAVPPSAVAARATAAGQAKARAPSRLLDAVADYRVDDFDRDLSVAIATLPMPVLLERVVMPLLREV